MLIISTSSLFTLALNGYKRYTDIWQIKHNVHIASRYIEKGLREFNQEDIIFSSDKSVFQGKNYNNKNTINQVMKVTQGLIDAWKDETSL